MTTSTSTTSETRFVDFLTSDGLVFSLDVIEFSKRSSFFKDMFEDQILNNSFEASYDPVPINVSKESLELMYKYILQYKDQEIKAISKPLTKDVLHVDDGVPEWDRDFMNSLSQESLYNLVISCDFVGFEELKRLCCAEISLVMKPRILDIQSHLDVDGNISEENLQKLKKESKWVK